MWSQRSRKGHNREHATWETACFIVRSGWCAMFSRLHLKSIFKGSHSTRQQLKKKRAIIVKYFKLLKKMFRYVNRCDKLEQQIIEFVCIIFSVVLVLTKCLCCVRVRLCFLPSTKCNFKHKNSYSFSRQVKTLVKCSKAKLYISHLQLDIRQKTSIFALFIHYGPWRIKCNHFSWIIL